MNNKRGSRNRKKNHHCSKKELRTVIKYARTPDAELRLSQAIDMLLEGMSREYTDDKDNVNSGKRPTELDRKTKGSKKVKPKKYFDSKTIKGGKQ